MRTFLFALMVVVVMLWLGCGFINPLYTTKDIYTSDKLPGEWMDTTTEYSISGKAIGRPKYSWRVEAMGNGHYMVIQQNGSSLFQYYYVTFVQLKGQLFADIQMSNDETGKQLTMDHCFARVQLTDNTMQIAELNDDYIEKQVKLGKLPLKHYYTKGHYMSDGMAESPQLMITEATPKLQQMIMALSRDKNAFTNDMVLVKK